MGHLWASGRIGTLDARTTLSGPVVTRSLPDEIPGEVP